MKHGSSGVVAIPMDYRRFYNLDHGKTVKVFYDSLLIIVPKHLEKLLKEKEDLIRKLLV